MQDVRSENCCGSTTHAPTITNYTVRTLIDELGTECQNVITLIHQLQLADLSDRQKAEILAEFMSAAIQMNVHCGEDFQTLIAEEMENLSDDDEEDSEQRNQVFT
ncbi:MAG TPA: hypothetical protein DD001_08420 [Microcoleaceae bacterium UBA10368]|jgi:hypothetical protein|nr:hypothetical protein [Microcoleaceae cyanobacterium UBA10368]HCV29269.1 hypothetical protein [Microcoleaceae cyanobacterium UBA9251]